MAAPESAIRGGSTVLEPQQVPELVLHDHHVGMAVPVDIADDMTLQPLWICPLNEVTHEPALTVILEPVKVVVRSVVGAGQVEVSIAVEICRADPVRVGVIAHDQVFREPHFARSGGAGAGWRRPVAGAASQDKRGAGRPDPK